MPPHAIIIPQSLPPLKMEEDRMPTKEHVVQVQAPRFLSPSRIYIINGERATSQPFGSILTLDIPFPDHTFPLLSEFTIQISFANSDDDDNQIEVLHVAVGVTPEGISSLACMPYESPVFNPKTDSDDIPVNITTKHTINNNDQAIVTIALKTPDKVHRDANGISFLRAAILLSSYPSETKIMIDFEDGAQMYLKSETNSPMSAIAKKILVARIDGEKGNRAPSFDFEAKTPNTQKYEQLLSWAAGSGDTKLFEKYLSMIPEGLTARDESGMTPLTWAALMGRVEVVRKALRRPTLAYDSPDSQGRTPLSWAAGNGHDSIVRGLLMHREPVLQGIQHFGPWKMDKSKKTPVTWAAGNGHTTIVDELLKYMSRPRFRTPALEGEQPFSEAAVNNQLETLRCIIDNRIKTSPASDDWLSNKLHMAVHRGWLCAVRALLICNADVDCVRGKRTPLCTAASSGYVDIINCLIEKGANVEYQTSEKESPIFFAVRDGKHRAVETLLNAGAAIVTSNAEGKTPLDIAVDTKQTMILGMLSERDTGKLAKSVEDLEGAVDNDFNATVVEFFSSGSPKFEEVPVGELMKRDKDQLYAKSEGREDLAFKWFHLPANNMRWVEVLITRLYGDLASAYRVLKPSRWVDQQHHGGDTNTDIPHACFMLPFFHSFEAGSSFPDSNMVLFMPYLHWEDVESYSERTDCIEGKANDPHEWTRQQRLIHAYLKGSKAHPHHLLHVRRTLDQFYYHNLKDTKKRDRDQAVSRFQFGLDKKLNVVELVDQLWLWVLVGPSGKAETVVSCFPSRDTSELLQIHTKMPPSPMPNQRTTAYQASSVLDPRGKTDVLQQVKQFMIEKSQQIETAYDLAGMIASRCSKVFLNPSNAGKTLQFAEIYKTAISSIFKGDQPYVVDRILETVDFLENSKFIDEGDLREVQKLRKELYENSLKRELPNDADMKSLSKVKATRFSMEIKKSFIEALQKLGHFHVLDITQEIGLLRLTKDLEDELNIMAMVFDEQQNILKKMEHAVRSMKSGASAKDSNGFELDHQDHRDSEIHFDGGDMNMSNNAKSDSPPPSPTSPTSPTPRFLIKHPTFVRKESELTSSPIQEDESPGGWERALGSYRNGSAGSQPDWGTKSGPAQGRRQSIFKMPIPQLSRKRIDDKKTKSHVWGLSGDSKNSSLPLRTVQRCVEDVKQMKKLAERANQALIFLVDLKQKQSNVMDARLARIQAEESFKMTLSSERQSTTLMVFTVVTIVFLPLSFIAAFFAIPVSSFSGGKGDSSGNLSLGFVSAIMFPVSAFISAAFIYLGFNADDLLENFRAFMKSKRPSNKVERDPPDMDVEDISLSPIYTHKAPFKAPY
ncbi:Ankyrin repeat domain-containing protein 50 [Cladobotryum mycophilum]|uniref:Ankyrin repeat domain-containing protein 50 n=1 Tax=Cladobotryum mycophilum TaxID=491253 RepID=A0ABR0SJ62_9HYPO